MEVETVAIELIDLEVGYVGRGCRGIEVSHPCQDGIDEQGALNGFEAWQHCVTDNGSEDAVPPDAGADVEMLQARLAFA